MKQRIRFPDGSNLDVDLGPGAAASEQKGAVLLRDAVTPKVPDVSRWLSTQREKR